MGDDVVSNETSSVKTSLTTVFVVQVVAVSPVWLYAVRSVIVVTPPLFSLNLAITPVAPFLKQA